MAYQWTIKWRRMLSVYSWRIWSTKWRRKDEPLQTDLACGRELRVQRLEILLFSYNLLGKTVSAINIDNDAKCCAFSPQAFALEQLDVKTSYKMVWQDSLVIRKTSWSAIYQLGGAIQWCKCCSFETNANDEGAHIHSRITYSSSNKCYWKRQ